MIGLPGTAALMFTKPLSCQAAWYAAVTQHQQKLFGCVTEADLRRMYLMPAG